MQIQVPNRSASFLRLGAPRSTLLLLVAASLSLLALTVSPAWAGIQVENLGDAVAFSSDDLPAGLLEIRLDGPCTELRETREGGEPFVFRVDESTPDGSYTFEATITPDELEARIRAESGDGSKLQCDPPLSFPRRTGAFRVADGRVELDLVASEEESEAGEGGREKLRAANDDASMCRQTDSAALVERTLYHSDDVSIDGRLCVGVQCSPSETVSGTTVRLKEPKVGIQFFDTSTPGLFPSSDWRIDVNDSHLGGAERFSILDDTAGTRPFTIASGARDDALFVSAKGRLGLGTTTPSTEIHVRDGDTPMLRLEQDGSQGFAPQIWNVAGNEVNFFVSDTTGNSRVPFRIRTGAPTDSLSIDADGRVGIGCGKPMAADFTVGSQFGGCASGPRSEVNAGDSHFTASSSRSMKENLERLTVDDILAKIGDIQVYRYDFIEGPDDRIGLMAEDFHRIFDRGSDTVLSGQEVQMALWLAVQELSARVEDLQGRLEAASSR